MRSGFLALSIDLVNLVGEKYVPGCTYNFIVCSTGVICPRRLFHYAPCHSLKVHQVVALLKDWHPLDPRLSILLVRIFLDLLLLNCTHVNLSKMFLLFKIIVEGVRWMYRIVGLGRIFAGILKDDVLAAWMLFFELSDIVGAAVNYDPAVLVGIVFCHFFALELLGLGLLLRLVVHLEEGKRSKSQRNRWRARRKLRNVGDGIQI